MVERRIAGLLDEPDIEEVLSRAEDLLARSRGRAGGPPPPPPADLPTLTEVDGAEIDEVEIDGVEFAGAEIDGAAVSSEKLNGAELQGAELHGAELHGAELHGAELQGAELHGAEVHGAELHGAALHAAPEAGVAELVEERTLPPARKQALPSTLDPDNLRLEMLAQLSPVLERLVEARVLEQLGPLAASIAQAVKAQLEREIKYIVRDALDQALLSEIERVEAARPRR